MGEGYDFLDHTASITDTNGHSTHVSGVIGAKANNGQGIAGINFNITLIPIRVVPNDGDETDANVIEAFEFAVKSGARVANCSFSKPAASRAVKDTIEAAGTHGLLAVMAAGNEGQDLNQNPTYPASFHTSNMIVVAASDALGDLAAPGTDILSSIAGGEYGAWDGTSMAAPQVTGVAALVLAAKPEISVARLRKILVTSVQSEASDEGLITSGGRIDASVAVEKALALGAH